MEFIERLFGLDVVDWSLVFDYIKQPVAVINYIVGDGFIYPLFIVGAVIWFAVLNFRIAVWAYHQIPVIGT